MPPAIARHPRMVVLDVEIKLDSRTTAQTLRKLALVFRRGRFVWIMGADSFAGLDRWNDWCVIPATLPLAVFARPEFCQKSLGFAGGLPALGGTGSQKAGAGCCPIFPRRHGHFSGMPLRRESSSAIRRPQRADLASSG